VAGYIESHIDAGRKESERKRKQRKKERKGKNIAHQENKRKKIKRMINLYSFLSLLILIYGLDANKRRRRGKKKRQCRIGYRIENEKILKNVKIIRKINSMEKT
jgi:hypothetical protein